MVVARRARVRAGAVAAALVAAVAAVMVSAAPAAPAWAHSQLISMSPADSSSVASAPTQVVLTFDEAIQKIGDAVLVTDPDGVRVDDGPPLIVGPTAAEKLRPLTVRGHYTVSYRVVSDDGHPVTRTLGFELTTGSAPTRSADPVASQAAVDTSHAGLVAVAGLLVLVAGGAVLGVRTRRRVR